MGKIDGLLDEVYASRERVTRDEIYRRAVAADLPADVITAVGMLPEGEYAQDEVSEAINQIDTGHPASGHPHEVGDLTLDSGRAPGAAIFGDVGVPATELSDEDLDRELRRLHDSRDETFRHGSDHALDNHDERMAEMESEYLRRFPQREVDPERLRDRESPAG